LLYSVKTDENRQPNGRTRAEGPPPPLPEPLGGSHAIVAGGLPRPRVPGRQLPVGRDAVRPYDLAKSMFLQALELPASERAAFLAEECGADQGLRREVEQLLRYHEESLEQIDSLSDAPSTPERVGEYRVLEVLGRGGMGVVYLARRGDEPPLALKVLRDGVLSPTLLARFRREASVLARLDHPGIARAIETGVETGPSGPRPWLAMERIEGEDLRTWARTPRPTAERLELLARMCDAVAHAHRHGVVHRDLKPENVLVRRDGQPVVLDFGVARLTDSDVRATTVMTSAGLLVGTIRYMSPEQAEARPDGIGPRSDVYSLAVLAYELLAGRLPYEVPENSVHRALVAVMTAPPRPLPELPAPERGRLERVLRAALAKDPDQRTPDAAALAADLRRVAAGRGPLARPPREGVARTLANARPLVALASGALLVGLALSTWRTPPTPADWVQGVLQPRRIYDRALRSIDSAAVRLHYTTRTLEREREALEQVRRARELLRTVGWQPWGARVERLALYRQAEAQYLIAERTNDVAGYEAASRLWYEAREPRVPRIESALPDTAGLSANALCAPESPDAWLSASMALADAARLREPRAYWTRALALAVSGEQAWSHERAAFAPGDGRHQGAIRAQQPQVEARLGVALVGHGVHAGLPDTVELGFVHLRSSIVLTQDEVEPSSLASHLHELGAGESRLAGLSGRRALLDSALVHLERAWALRRTIDGYTSRYLSRLELAQAERLRARMEPALAGPAVTRAESLFALPPADRALLGRVDQALFDLGALATALDRCCVRRDSSAFPRVQAELARIAGGIDRARMPLVLIEAQALQGRLEGMRYALTGNLRDRRAGHQSVEQALLAIDEGTSAPLWGRLQREREAFMRPPRPYDLDYPLSGPF
jgi:serine/threonine protein kinase